MPKVTLDDVNHEVLGIHERLDRLEEVTAVLLVMVIPEEELPEALREELRSLKSEMFDETHSLLKDFKRK